MRRLLRDALITLALIFERMARALGSSVDQVFTGFSSLVDKVISKEQEAPELSTEEKFRYYTGVLGYHEKQARDAGDIETVEAIQDDMWAMAHAYKNGDLENFLWKKTQYEYIYDLIVDEETGEETILKINTKNGTTEEIKQGVAGE